MCPFGYCIICCEKMQYCIGENRRKYQNYAIQWAAYQEALHTCDTGTNDIECLVDFETFLGLVELVHTNLTFNDTSHALVAAEAEQAHQHDSDDEAHEAARHEELHQIAMAPQSPNMQQQPDPVAMDLVSMECHDGDNIGEQQLNDIHQQFGHLVCVLQGPPCQNATRIMPGSHVCCECGDVAQVVCPSGYCIPCCEMEMCGCDNKDNDYSSSSDGDDDQDGDADNHANDRMVAFDVADDQCIQFVAAAADEEDYYDAPDYIRRRP